MVLQFSEIPLHLRGKIAEKIDYFDLEEMEMSSIDGKTSVEYIKIMPVIKTTQISFSSKSGFILIKPDPISKNYKDFSFLNEIPNLPRFFVSQVMVELNASPECIHHSLLNDRYRFIDNGVKVSWYYEGVEKEQIMKKLTELFNIVGISTWASCISDALFFSMPIFEQVQHFSAHEAILSDEKFLSLKASYINFKHLSSYPHMEPTLLTFLKQYFQNQREINSLTMHFVNHPKVVYEDIFSKLEYFKLLWSLETHESSDYSYISRKELRRNIGDVTIYLIRGGEKKLIVFDSDLLLSVRPTLDENDEVLMVIDPTYVDRR